VQILEQSQNVFARLFGPSTLSKLEDLGLGGSTNVPSESLEGNALFVFEHIFDVLNGLLEFKSFHGISSFESVLEVSSQIVDLAFGS
jgi:hypothetical protein